MSVIKWGKPKLEFAKYGESTWTELDTPVEGTTQLTTDLGDELTAPIEGGEIIDRKRKAATYTLEFELYAIGDKPIVDVNGVITDNYAIRLTPEDSSLKGFQFVKSSVTVEDTFDASIGQKWKYTFTALLNDDGTMMDEYDGSGS